MRDSAPLPPPEHTPWLEFPAESCTGGSGFYAKFPPRMLLLVEKLQPPAPSPLATAINDCVRPL